MKASTKLAITTAVLGILLAILAVGDLDFSISKMFINKSSTFGKFFNRVGEMPAYLGMVIGIAILYGGRSKNVLWQNILGSVFGLSFLAFFSFLLVVVPFHYAYEHVEGGAPKSVMIVIFILAGILYLGTLTVIHKLGPEKIRRYRKHGLVLVLLILIEILIVNLVKVLWARPRMRSVESIEQFKYWFEINGPTGDNELKSFPSGHTSNAFVAIAYSMFIPAVKQAFVKWFTAFALTWGSMVALSRIIRGDHFFSDVVVGGYITVIVFYAISGLVFKDKPVP